MAPEEICELLRSQFGDAIESTAVAGGHPYAQVLPDRWPDVALFLRDDKRLSMNLLRSITSLDLQAEGKLACVYDLMSLPVDRGIDLILDTQEFAVRVVTDRDEPLIPSVAAVWSAAD